MLPGVGVTHLEKGSKYDYVTSCGSNFIDMPLSHLENFSIAQKKFLIVCTLHSRERFLFRRLSCSKNL